LGCVTLGGLSCQDKLHVIGIIDTREMFVCNTRDAALWATLAKTTTKKQSLGLDETAT
jgi:hypothetical protein